ncbi:unnamed protein product [Candidula unifasciata]|uniref:Uncharacterized protein n=1 Tax=Candidula unifasciata TaxID=100452 RepID=A0A8S3YY84_9EUPU|nr:unnamed protein product [Candidula unifasciata]
MACSKHRVALVVVGLLLVGVVVAVAVPLSLRGDQEKNGKYTPRFQGQDCYPEAEGKRSAVNKTACLKRGCAFSTDVPAGQPVCQYTEGQYRLSVSSIVRTSLGLQATLQQTGSAPFGGDIRSWRFTFESRGDDIAHFVFDATDSSRYKVPKPVDVPARAGKQPKYESRITNNHSFAFEIVRRDTGTVVWDTNIGAGSLILSDQFLQISSRLPSRNVYGLGEHMHETFRHQMNRTWASFARDQPPSWDAEANLYGVHPFYTCVEDAAGNSHGVLMLNSNAQEYSFTELPSLTFRTIGGILDFYIFMGPSPEQVIQQYTGAVGRPMMPPYWALGFQLCRYGYNNISNLQEAVESTARYQIPHDVQYVDIDHMDTQKIFTVSEQRFPGLNQYFQELQSRGMRIIYILDPCLVANETDYRPYEEMKRIQGNIKWAVGVEVPANSSDTDGAILGYVWPQGKTVFPDYLKNSVKQVWKSLIVDYRHNLTFDGLWIDMNEPANFGTNEERPFNWPEKDKPYWSLKCPSNTWEDPPYRPKAAYRFDSSSRPARLSDKTICMSTVQGDQDQYRHYDVHSIYGWSQTDATLEAARLATGERSIVISRSTFPGSGTYAGHWLGDNVSQWKDMQSSIIGILEFNLFGIPYIGADICGFFENTSTELCKRWMQLGAFYTYSRNHNGITYLNQAPGQLGDDVAFASRDILRIRYQLLPYLYTLFHQAHTVGGTVIRPLHHEFPTETDTLSINKQFMWGACLLISPILEENQTQLEYYLPKARWYNYYTHEQLLQTSGAWRRETVDGNSKPSLHVRGGCAFIQQEYANNTHFSRRLPLTLVAALDGDGRAGGSIFWDDGVSINTYENGQYLEAQLSATNNSLTVSVTHWVPSADWDDLIFNTAQVLGVSQKVKSVYLQGQPQVLTFTQTEQLLEIVLPALPLTQNVTIYWSV